MMAIIYQEMGALIIILNKIGFALVELNPNIHYVHDVIQIVSFVNQIWIVNNVIMDITIIMAIAYNVNHNVKLVYKLHLIVLHVQINLNILLMENV